MVKLTASPIGGDHGHWTLDEQLTFDIAFRD